MDRGARVPLHFPSGGKAVLAAISPCGTPDLNSILTARIPDTLHLETVLGSKALLADIENRVEIESGSLPGGSTARGTSKFNRPFGSPGVDPAKRLG